MKWRNYVLLRLITIIIHLNQNMPKTYIENERINRNKPQSIQIFDRGQPSDRNLLIYHNQRGTDAMHSSHHSSATLTNKQTNKREKKE